MNSLLSLWSKVGSAIGSAIVVVIWSSQISNQLRTHLSTTATEADVTKLFGQVTLIRSYEFDDPMRVGAIVAHRRALYYCIALALGITFIPLITVLFQNNYFLGKTQNAVTNLGNDGLPVVNDGNNEEVPPAKTKKDAFLRFWAGR